MRWRLPGALPQAISLKPFRLVALRLFVWFLGVIVNQDGNQRNASGDHAGVGARTLKASGADSLKPFGLVVLRSFAWLLGAMNVRREPR